MAECDRWIGQVDEKEPIGVLFSGGIDSGAVVWVLYHLMLKKGIAPNRLKAFPLAVQGWADVKQAHAFLKQLGLSLFLESVEVALEDLDYEQAIRVTEDYKPLDVQSATMTLALCREIRARYPDWKYLVDGDGGDENLKDYPIEENPELTIRSVLNNLMLYQEGWGVDKIKHSLTYSGGQSRGHIRSSAPVRATGFKGFSPYALSNVIEVAEKIPFIDLTSGDHEALYTLKGDIVQRGVRFHTGLEMPVFEKRRFQRGVLNPESFGKVFPQNDKGYREAFDRVFG